MTREEAIYKLEQTKRYSKYLSDDEIAAVTMAIKTLEAWNEVQKEIYKQIDALDEIHEFRDKKAYFKALDIVNKYLKEVENGKSN